MYYISTDKVKLENYNDLVSQKENYDNINTIKWAVIIKHKDLELYAILANDKYLLDAETVEHINDWI